MLENRQVIEELELADNLKMNVSVTYDESKIFLDVLYMDGKFTVQRNFTNNYIGLEELELAKQEFNTEEKVRKYFGL